MSECSFNTLNERRLYDNINQYYKKSVTYPLL
jgi:hypothetical protein